jgi:hypothetical protein
VKEEKIMTLSRDLPAVGPLPATIFVAGDKLATPLDAEALQGGENVEGQKQAKP